MDEAHRLEQVAQEDREAAANLSFTRDGGGYCYLLLSGKVDDDPQIQAFARHRRAAISAYEATRQGELVATLQARVSELEREAASILQLADVGRRKRSSWCHIPLASINQLRATLARTGDNNNG